MPLGIEGTLLQEIYFFSLILSPRCNSKLLLCFAKPSLFDVLLRFIYVLFMFQLYTLSWYNEKSKIKQ